MRTENDKLGSIELNDDTLYGIQTARAADNFSAGGRTVHLELIHAMTEIKKAAAAANASLGLLETAKKDAIIAAADRILTGRHDDMFVTDALQGGAGTSTHMNVNEVIANLGLAEMGAPAGAYHRLHPLDDVNLGQSTNDVYPTALRIAAIRLLRQLSDECSMLQESLQHKEQQFAAVMKLGRTQMMDALPLTLGQEFGSYAQAVARDRWRIYKAEERLRYVNLGGTAIGTGSNTSIRYSYKVTELLREATGIGLARAEFPMDMTQNHDVFVEVSGLLKALAVTLIKISSDLRLMNSGPAGGLGEIRLEALQAGSTIMPGKVNPVMPEMMTQVAIKVIANDTAITTCAAMGSLELNAFLPLIADALLDSLKMLVRALPGFRTRCIDTIVADEARCMAHLEHSAVLVTALAPYIGYEKAEAISASCQNDPDKIKEQILEEKLLEESVLNDLLQYKSARTYR